MENENKFDNFFNIPIDAEAKELIRTIAIWARLVAIIAFVSYALALLIAIIRPDVQLEGTRLSLGSSRVGSIIGALISGAIGIAINLFLYRFAVAAKDGVETQNTIQLETAFDNLRTYFKIIGIILIIVLVIFGLIIVFAILGAVIGSFR